MIRFGSCLPVASCQLPDKEPPQTPFKEVSVLYIWYQEED